MTRTIDTPTIRDTLIALHRPSRPSDLTEIASDLSDEST